MRSFLSAILIFTYCWCFILISHILGLTLRPKIGVITVYQVGVQKDPRWYTSIKFYVGIQRVIPTLFLIFSTLYSLCFLKFSIFYTVVSYLFSIFLMFRRVTSYMCLGRIQFHQRIVSKDHSVKVSNTINKTLFFFSSQS